MLQALTHLAGSRRPDLEGGIIAAGQNPVAVELKAGDHVIIVAAHYDWAVNRLVEPPGRLIYTTLML